MASKVSKCHLSLISGGIQLWQKQVSLSRGIGDNQVP